MIIEKFRVAYREKRYVKYIFLAVILLIWALYFKAFFTTGVFFEDTFLKKQVEADCTYYTGKSKFGNIKITVKSASNDGAGKSQVFYNLPNNINKTYSVAFTDKSDYPSGLENIMIKDEMNNVVFEGEYDKNNPFLINKNGEIFFEESSIRVVVNYESPSPFTSDYTISLKNTADFAAFSNDTIRGQWPLLLLALFLFAITFIDIKYPSFFFNLRYSWGVSEPEPSDFYLAMQKFSWYAYPIIGVILMITALNTH